MTDIMFETPSDTDIAKVTITKECITDGKEPVIEKVDTKSLTEKLAIPERKDKDEFVS